MPTVNIAIIVLLLTAPALADPARCAKGVAYAKAGDLPHASLYLEGCDGEDTAHAAADVAKKLRASQLSVIDVVSDQPAVLETDAMPGEKIATPASIWAKAGRYKIRANGMETTTTLEPHSRATVVLTTPKASPHVKAGGTVNFDDQATEAPVTGPPPEQKHPSMLPCKYEGCETHSGEELVDPLATHAEAVHLTPPELRIGMRVGVASTEKIAMSFAATVHYSWLAARVDGGPRERDGMGYTDLGVSAGLSHVVWSPDAAWISLGAALRTDMRTGRSEGYGATAEAELALRSLPATVAARYEQGFDGSHAIVVEVGADWRWFR